MIKERYNSKVETRVRFKIQDLIDKFESEWKHEIFFLRRKETDSEGFQKRYVPKGSKLAQEALGFVKILPWEERKSRKTSSEVLWSNSKASEKGGKKKP